jgi:putative FmdB family regulatory protein
MPIYEYQCRECGHEFELLLLAHGTATCPSCQSLQLEQLLSGFTVSSKETTKARVKAARRQALSSRNYKDQKVAEAEEIREHHPQPEPKQK